MALFCHALNHVLIACTKVISVYPLPFSGLILPMDKLLIFFFIIPRK